MELGAQQIIPVFDTNSGASGWDQSQFAAAVQTAIGGSGYQQLTASGVALTANVGANVTDAKVLTTGIWEVWAAVAFAPALNTEVVELTAGFNTNSASIPGPARVCVPLAGSNACAMKVVQSFPAGFVPGAQVCIVIPPLRVTVTQPSLSVYLVARSNFTVNVMSVGGSFWSTRVG